MSNAIRNEDSRLSPHSCFQSVQDSRYTDAALIIGFIALLILGILATVGVFNFMGAANAAYFSYGMYGGAALFFIAEVIKIAMNCCKKTTESVDDQSYQIDIEKTNKKATKSDVAKTTKRHQKEVGKMSSERNVESPPIIRKQWGDRRFNSTRQKDMNPIDTDEEEFAKIQFELKMKMGAKRRANHMVEKFFVNSTCSQGAYTCHHECTISFATGQIVKTALSKEEIITLSAQDVIHATKIHIKEQEGGKKSFNDVAGLHFHLQGTAGSAEDPEQMLKRIQENA